MKYLTIILITIILCGCGPQKEKVEIAKLGMNFGYSCAKDNITLKECEVILDQAIVNKL